MTHKNKGSDIKQCSLATATKGTLYQEAKSENESQRNTDALKTRQIYHHMAAD